MNELERRRNFYLLISAAAAILIGLLFVVITLAAERIVQDGHAKIRLYLTPTVLYLATVLLLAGLLTFPGHTRFKASLCICLVGFAGLIYSGSFLIGGARDLLLSTPVAAACRPRRTEGRASGDSLGVRQRSHWSLGLLTRINRPSTGDTMIENQTPPFATKSNVPGQVTGVHEADEIR